MFDLSFLTAFLAGLVSFFAPCVIPLLPAYIGYVTGVSASDLQRQGLARYRTKILLSSLFYILGFSLIFVILGTTAAGIGQVLRRYDDLIRIGGGLMILFFGLNFAGFLPIQFLAKERRFELPLWVSNLGYMRSFLVGVVFAFAWTPCVGAILGSILALAAVSQTATTGALLLLIYSLGISLPFLLVSFTLAQAPMYLKKITRHIETVAKIAGILLVIIGILLITDTYKYVNGWLFEIAYSFGYTVQ